jgi:hypothetical protein
MLPDNTPPLKRQSHQKHKNGPHLRCWSTRPSSRAQTVWVNQLMTECRWWLKRAWSNSAQDPNKNRTPRSSYCTITLPNTLVLWLSAQSPMSYVARDISPTARKNISKSWAPKPSRPCSESTCCVLDASLWPFPPSSTESPPWAPLQRDLPFQPS